MPGLCPLIVLGLRVATDALTQTDISQILWERSKVPKLECRICCKAGHFETVTEHLKYNCQGFSSHLEQHIEVAGGVEPPHVCRTTFIQMCWAQLACGLTLKILSERELNRKTHTGSWLNNYYVS